MWQTNEKYKGDALLQKSFTVDFLTKTQKKNEGEVPSYLGSYGNAANTVVFPLTGRSEIGKAKRSVGNAVVLSVAGGLILTVVYLVFADSIIAMFGGTVNEETFRCSQEYFFYITLGIPFYMFGQAMNPIIRADGNPKFAMVSTLAGAVINIILDPIFIFCFKWGMG